jgi:hypothetical protein
LRLLTVLCIGVCLAFAEYSNPLDGQVLIVGTSDSGTLRWTLVKVSDGSILEEFEFGVEGALPVPGTWLSSELLTPATLQIEEQALRLSLHSGSQPVEVQVPSSFTAPLEFILAGRNLGGEPLADLALLTRERGRWVWELIIDPASSSSIKRFSFGNSNETPVVILGRGKRATPATVRISRSGRASVLKVCRGVCRRLKRVRIKSKSAKNRFKVLQIPFERDQLAFEVGGSGSTQVFEVFQPSGRKSQVVEFSSAGNVSAGLIGGQLMFLQMTVDEQGRNVLTWAPMEVGEDLDGGERGVIGLPDGDVALGEPAMVSLRGRGDKNFSLKPKQGSGGPSKLATPTVQASPTLIAEPTATFTFTPTVVVSETPIPTATVQTVASPPPPTSTSTPSATATLIPATFTATPTRTPTSTPTVTATFTTVATPAPTVTATPTLLPTSTPTLSPTPARLLDRVALVDANTGEIFPGVGSLESGALVDIASLSSTELSIIATTRQAVGSIVFDLNNGVHVKTDSLQPYALFGDSSMGINPGNIPLGDNLLRVSVFDGAGGTGMLLEVLEIGFTMIDSTPPPTVTPTPVPTSIGDVSNLRTISEWERLFVGAEPSNHPGAWEKASSGDSWDHYNLAYTIDGYVAMFQAVPNTQYLDQVLAYVQEVIRVAQPSYTLSNSRYKDSFMGWGAWSHPDPNINGGEYALFESYFWRYVAKMLRVMKETEGVLTQETYRVQYDAILAFLEVNIFDKWMKRGSSNIYRSRTHMAAHWAYIAMELSELTSSATRKQNALIVMNNIDLDFPGTSSSLKGQMMPHPLDDQAYFWSSVWDSTTTPGQDVAHGNNVIAYVVESAERGYNWNTQEMGALSRTLLEVIWRQDNGSNYYSDFVDGSGAGTGWFSEGFVKLGRYNIEVQRRMENHTIGRGVQLYGNGALNARRLGVNY